MQTGRRTVLESLQNYYYDEVQKDNNLGRPSSACLVQYPMSWWLTTLMYPTSSIVLVYRASILISAVQTVIFIVLHDESPWSKNVIIISLSSSFLPLQCLLATATNNKSAAFSPRWEVSKLRSATPKQCGWNLRDIIEFHIAIKPDSIVRSNIIRNVYNRWQI